MQLSYLLILENLYFQFFIFPLKFNIYLYIQSATTSFRLHI